jgi:hypothetical protein
MTEVKTTPTTEQAAKPVNKAVPFHLQNHSKGKGKGGFNSSRNNGGGKAKNFGSGFSTKGSRSGGDK